MTVGSGLAVIGQAVTPTSETGTHGMSVGRSRLAFCGCRSDLGRMAASFVFALLAVCLWPFAADAQNGTREQTRTAAGSQQAETVPSAIPLRPAQGIRLAPTLSTLDRKLVSIKDAPTPTSVNSAMALLSGIKFNTTHNAIIIGKPLGPIENILSSDPEYQKNFAALAALHLASTGQRAGSGLPPERATPVAADGGTSNFRIVGNAALMRRSFVVRVYTNVDYVCTGVLVSPDTVLTALHCECGGEGRITRIQYNDKQGNVRNVSVGGVHSLIDDASTPQAICKPDTKGSPYARYPVQEAQKGHDLVIVKLQNGIEDEVASPISLVANAGQLSAARVAIVSGFGDTDAAGQHRAGNGWAPSTVVALAGAPGCNDCGIGEFAAGPTPLIGGKKGVGNDTCGGDSGGPVFLIEKSSVETAFKEEKLTIDFLTSKVPLMLAGITSRGLTSESRCGQGGIYEMLNTSWVSEALKRHNVPIVTWDDFVPF